MEIKLLSEIISSDKIMNASLYSYFMIYKDDQGTRELLPSDNHSSAYPLVIDENNNVKSGKINFFNKPFLDGFIEKELIDENDVKYYFIVKKFSKCIVVNLLDNCYGHSLLKLFNLAGICKKFGDQYDFFVIAPPSLLAFLPFDKVNVCIVNKSFGELGKGYPLNNVMLKIKGSYDVLDFAFLNTYMDYASREMQFEFLHLFDSDIQSLPVNNIVFYYRKDKLRRWGLFSQKNRIIKLFKILSRFFKDVDFVIIGEKDGITFPDFIKDQRCDTFTKENEFIYNALLKKSLMVVGIHGSHLILPSLLSRQVFHIVPRYKLKNIGEDVYNVNSAMIESSSSDVNIPVNTAFCYPNAKGVASMIMVSFMASVEKEYKRRISSNKLIVSQSDYIQAVYPFFNYEESIQWWNRREAFVLRSHKLLRG